MIWFMGHHEIQGSILNKKKSRDDTSTQLQAQKHNWTILLFHVSIKKLDLLTHSIVMRPSWETVSCAATKEFPNILQNPKIHYHIHMRLPLVPILSQINPVHYTPSYVRSTLTLSTHLHLGLSSGLFHSGFPTKILYAFLFSLYMPCSSHPPWLDHYNYI
jgi:hypothetical protein